MEPLIVGIGVGAGTAAIGYFRETSGRTGEVEVAQTHSFRRAIRPALCFDQASTRWYVGDAAWLKGRQTANAGHYLSSPVPWLSWPGPLAVGTTDTVPGDDGAEALTSSWLLGQLLRTLIDGLIKQAEDDFRIEEVVLAAPLARGGDWRPALEKACIGAGVRLAAVVAEPLCILTTYLCESQESLPAAGEQVLLVNWGAAALQLTTVRRVDAGLPARFAVVDVASAPIGGNDVDRRILAFLRQRAGNDLALPMAASPGRAALWQRVEEAKISLSNAMEDGRDGDPSYLELIDVPSAAGIRHVELSADDLAALLDGSAENGRPCPADTVRDICMRVHEQGGPVQYVFVAGGSAALPICRSVVRSVFGPDVRFLRLPSECPLDTVVVRGATWQAAAGQGKPVPVPRLEAPRPLRHDVEVLLETAGAVQTFRAFDAGTPLTSESPLRRTRYFRTIAAGPTTVRCMGRWRDLPYERLTAHERRLIALNLGPLAAGTEVVADVCLDKSGKVAMTVRGPGWHLGRVEAGATHLRAAQAACRFPVISDPTMHDLG